MKYIIISDIHGNLEAFRAVMETFPSGEGISFICLGDIIGYGANPNECIDKVKTLGAVSIIGNHEAAVLGKTDILYFNEYAAAAVLWTKDNLDKVGKDYIAKLPYVHTDKKITASHGTLHSPEEFIYMVSASSAMHTFREMKTNICFVGHSHVPGTYVLRDGKVFEALSSKMKIEKGLKYIINAGSIGQPRDNDNRACYCIYDTEKEQVEFKRVEYDVKEARKKIIDAGLPEVLGERLLYGR